MHLAPTPENERERLNALYRYDVLDTPPEAEFDDFTRLASNICGTPIALISLVDAGRQWFKSKVGLEAPETPRDISFCGHAIQGNDLFEVPDAFTDVRFYDNPLVICEPNVRFYAGTPLVTPEGLAIGTLCVIDSHARQLTSLQREGLRVLGRQVVQLLELRRIGLELRESNAKLAQQASLLQESQLLIESVIENIPVMVFLKRADDLRFAMLNKAGEQLLGASREEFLGKNDYDFFPKEQADIFFAKDLDGLTRGFTDTSEEWIKARTSGKRIVRTKKNVLRDANGTPLYLIGISEDITDRIQVEDALLASKEAAERANRVKDSFLATMSHEIRTPLGGMLGMLELLSHSQLVDEQREILDMACDSGRSLLSILNDILDWSKIVSGKLELAPNPTSIAQLLSDVANTYVHVAAGNSVTLVQKIDARLSPMHLVDSLRLSQVLNNFVSNAIKFSPGGGLVELRADLVTWREGVEEVRLSVKDRGIGISKAVQLQLFKHYSQASAETARMYGGTGLGLAICRRLADLLEGLIEVDSAPDEGSTFSITVKLPIVKGVPKPADAAAKIDAAVSVLPRVDVVAAADAPLILVADDHPINRKLLVLQLGELGLHAITAEDGREALSLWRDGHYALVITDLHMPNMDGYTLTRTIRAIEAAESRTRIPIFAWTASALFDEMEKCRAAGMDELLVKPVGLAQLKQVLEKWLSVSAQSVPELKAPRAQQAAELPALDVSVLKALVGDDAAVIRELLGDFRTSSVGIAAEFRDACQRGLPTVAGAAVHKLRSSALSVGALKLGDLCGHLEQAGKAGDSATLARLQPGFEQEWVAVEGCLDVLLQTPR